MTKFPQTYALFCRILSQEKFMRFLQSQWVMIRMDSIISNAGALVVIRVRHIVSRLLGIETFLNFLRVSVSVSKILVSKKSLSIGLENI